MKLDSSLLQRAVPPGSMRYYAWLYSAEAQRDVMAALFLIEAELHETARAPHEVAHIRLQWWREEIECLIAGKPRHPATQVLLHKGSDFTLLHGVALSAAQELANTTYESDIELNQYLRGGLGGLFAMAAQSITHTPEINAAAIQLGAFVRQVEIMRDLRQDFHQGRLYLPLTALDELAIEYETLQSNIWPPAFTQWLQSRSQQMLMSYRQLKQSLLHGEKSAMRPLLVLSELHARLLQILVADPLTNMQTRVELTPLQKLWTAWRAARFAS